MDELQPADIQLKCNVFGLTFVQKYEKKMKEYRDAIDGGKGKPGKVAEQVQRGSEVLRIIPVVGDAVASAVATAAPIIGKRFHKIQVEKVIRQVEFFEVYPEDDRSKLLEAVVELCYMFEHQLGTVYSLKTWPRALKELAKDAVDRAINYFRETSEQFSAGAVVKGVLLGSSKTSHHVTHFSLAGKEVIWETSKMFSEAGAVVRQLGAPVYYRVHSSLSSNSMFTYGYRLPCDLLESWETGDEYSDFNGIITDQKNVLKKREIARIMLNVRCQLENANPNSARRSDAYEAIPHVSDDGRNDRQETNVDPQPDWTELHIAAATGNLGMVKDLIANKVDPSITDNKGWTPLHLAAVKGHTEIVKYLADVKNQTCFLQDYEGFTPLHLAVRAGHLLLVRFFIEDQYADKNGKNKLGWTLLFTAAREGHADIVRHLIEKEGVDPKQKMGKGYSLLHCATEYGGIKVMKYLIDEKMTSCNLKDDIGRGPVHIAAEKGYIKIVRYLVDKKKVSHKVKARSGVQPIHSAAIGGQLEVLQYFLDEKGVDCNSWSDEMAPIHFAASKGHLEVVKYLIEKRGVSARHPSWTWEKEPVHFAAQGGHFELVKYLIDEEGVTPLAKEEYEDKIPIHYAAKIGHLNMVKYFVEEKNVDFNFLSTCRLSSVHYAAKEGHVELVRYFVEERNADPHQVTELGDTLIQLASKGGHVEVIMYLLKNHNVVWTVKEERILEIVKCIVEEKGYNPHEVSVNGNLAHFAAGRGLINVLKYLFEKHSVDVSARDNNGWSLLHFASFHGQFDTLRYLIDEKCIDVNVKTYGGETALYYAVKWGHMKTIQYLIEEKGADYKDRENLKGYAPIHFAVYFDHIDVVRYFIETKHVSVNTMTDRGVTPLYLAVTFNDSIEMIKLLCKHNADCKFADNEGSSLTVLSQARLFCSKEIVEYLTRYLEYREI